MIIRDYQETDILEIRKVIRKSLDAVVLKYYSRDVVKKIYQYYDSEKIKEFEKVFVSEENNEINGCVAFTSNEIKMLYPDPEFRKRAYVAVMLLEYSKEQIRKNGFSKAIGQALESSKDFLGKQGELGNSYLEKIGNVEFKVTPVSIDL
jgi:N-acetylglutamate synthase-like GNAT family acetyltransferase